MMSLARFGLVVCAHLMGLTLYAQEQPANEALGNAAANAVNPMAFITKLQVQPNFTWKEDMARQLNLTTRLVQPTASIGLPFIKSKNPSKVYTIYRFEIPIIGQTFTETPALDATGLSDIIVADLVAFKQSWGIIGGGPGLLIPTNKPDPISGGKWCAGLATVVLNTKTKGFMYGALIQQYFSFAGNNDRPSRNFMLFQPIVNKVLGGGYFVGCSPIMNFDWENDTYSIPIIVTFGKAFAKNLSAFIGPQIMLTGPTSGDLTLQFQLNAMFPPSK
ncbi:MAG: hypothetical protein KA479_13880 [Saprospiraceae bacterium]|nr:hypothetical protein [Saprospiraceae bacterium]